MFFDTNFLIELEKELGATRVGPARRFLGGHGSQKPGCLGLFHWVNSLQAMVCGAWVLMVQGYFKARVMERLLCVDNW